MDRQESVSILDIILSYEFILGRFKCPRDRDSELYDSKPILFNDTIRANIAYAKQGNATEKEIIEVATSANAQNFISGLPQGYNHLMGERGVQLSGGQKQRIAIARAIIKNPKILLLDEATSALDAESERIVQDALDVVMIDRTKVIIAHRLATIKRADTIALLKNGVIAEKGTHDQLMGITHGLYASFVASMLLPPYRARIYFSILS
ncbi:ABC transporter B family member 9-like [Amaranthus tricolor]|uniref:ABC transporter B family member 9-like n=1 Tax=Amaranthus tricolor TaxID=29722 RepID=UPI00258BC506|nr:ABC transporter B family member 9-like [Amaranthus tricolor]